MRYFLLLLLFAASQAKAQLPNCAGVDSNCLFMDNGNAVYRFDPALPISASNPSIFISYPNFSSAGLAIGPNINGGAASPTFYTTNIGIYHYWNGSAWVSTGHTASTVNITEGSSVIYGKNGSSGYLSKYTGTGNDVFFANGLPNSGPFDVVADQSNNLYEVDISTTIGHIYKYNPAGVIIDTYTVLNVPAQSAGPGFAIIGNQVYFGVNTAPGVYYGTLVNDTVNASVLGSFNISYGDFANCPNVSQIAPGTASLVYPTCAGNVTVNISSPNLTAGATVFWNFGDPGSGINNTSTLNNTSHTFSGNGTFTVTTIITNSAGVDTVTNTIIVNNYVYGSSTATICEPNSFNGYTSSGVYIDTFSISPICDSIHTLTLTVNPQPFISLGPDVTICSGQNTTLDAGPGFSTYFWDNNAPTQTRIVNTPGTYYCTVTDVNTCSNSDTINVLQSNSVQADFTLIKHLGCKKDTIELINNSTGTNVFQWYFGDSQSSQLMNPTHVYNAQLVYTVTLIAGNPPCQDTMSMQVDMTHPLNANAYVYGGSPQSPLVITDSTCVLTKLKAQSLSTPLGLTLNEFYWGDGTSTNTGYNVIADHQYTDPGNYHFMLVITDSLGCKDTVKREIYVDGESYCHFTASDSVICVGTPIVFYDTMSPYTLSFTYDFGDGSKVDDLHHPIHSYDIGNNYQVTLTSRNLICPEYDYTGNLVVDDYPLLNLGPDTSICPGITGSIVLQNLLNTAGVYQWSTGETANSITVTESGHYWVTATSPNADCRASDSIFITRDCYLNIPNAFSPDGDGLNEYFFPRELLSSGVKLFRMNIYNRWGENIFTTTAIDGRGWDGKYNSKAQPMGVYVYVMDVEFLNGVKKTFKGNVTLMR